MKDRKPKKSGPENEKQDTPAPNMPPEEVLLLAEAMFGSSISGQKDDGNLGKSHSEHIKRGEHGSAAILAATMRSNRTARRDWKIPKKLNGRGMPVKEFLEEHGCVVEDSHKEEFYDVTPPAGWSLVPDLSGFHTLVYDNYGLEVGSFYVNSSPFDGDAFFSPTYRTVDIGFTSYTPLDKKAKERVEDDAASAGISDLGVEVLQAFMYVLQNGGAQGYVTEKGYNFTPKNLIDLYALFSEMRQEAVNIVRDMHKHPFEDLVSVPVYSEDENGEDIVIGRTSISIPRKDTEDLMRYMPRMFEAYFNTPDDGDYEYEAEKRQSFWKVLSAMISVYEGPRDADAVAKMQQEIGEYITRRYGKK